jgi:hypothetical protein
VTTPVYLTAASAFWPGGRGVEALRDAAAPASTRVIGDDALEEALRLRGLRPLSRTARLAMAVSADVWPPDLFTSSRDAVVLGSAWASVGPLADFVQVAAAEGPRHVFPMAFPNAVASVHAGYIATLLGLSGPNISVCGEAAGLEAVLEGLALVQSGRADRVLAVGAEAAEPTVRAARPEASEAAGAVRLSRNREDRALAVVTGWWSAAGPEDLPAFPAEESDLADPGHAGLAGILGPCGAALGVLQVATAAAAVAESGLPRVVAGRSGVRGYAAVQLGPVSA